MQISHTKGHPEILSPVFDRVEFELDRQLSRDLGEISGRLGTWFKKTPPKAKSAKA